jgi:O-antigen/teichoic acid export membrane protein
VTTGGTRRRGAALRARLRTPAARTALAGTAWMSYGYLAGYAAQGLYFVLLARELGSSGLGTFAGAMAVVSIAAPFSGLGRGNVLLMRTARDPAAYRGELWMALVTLVGCGGLLVVALAVVAAATLPGTQFGQLLVTLGLSELLFARIVELAAQCFQAHDRLRISAHLLLSMSVVRLVAVIGFALAPGVHSPATWGVCYAGASAATACAALWLTARRLGTPRRPARRLDPALGQGLAFSVGMASKTIYADIDKAMLSRLATTATAGIYTAAYRVVSLAYAPVLAFLYSSNARFFRVGAAGGGGGWRVARSSWPVIAAYALAVGVGLALAAPLLPLVLGDDYDESVEVLRWLWALPLVMATHGLFGDALMGMGRQGLRSALQLGTAGLNVALNAWLIPAYSWQGATVATYVSEIVLAATLVVLLRRAAARDAGPG